MSQGRIWLGPTGSETLLEIKGRLLTEEPFEILREGRTADGSYVADQIAVKTIFTLSYEVITETNLDVLIALFELDEILNLQVEREDLTVDEFDVKVRPLSRVRLLTKDVDMWQNVPMVLEEV